MPKPISIGADCHIVEKIRRSRGRKAVYRGFLLPEKIPIIAKESPRHELIREVVCSLVAQSLGLPTPEPFLVQSPMPESRQDWWFATQQEAQRRTISEAIFNDTLARWPHLRAAIAFDAWIGNADRTPDNLLFLGANKLALIDHGSAFPQGMRPRTRLQNLLADRVVQGISPKDRRQLALEIKREAVSFSKVNFSEVKIAGLAKGWQGNPEFGECCRLLEDRIPFLPQVIDSALGLGEGQGAFRFDWS